MSARKEDAPTALCRHCHERVASRSRGLCWHCYHTPEVIALYPTTSVYGHRGASAATRPADRACLALPGTEVKVAELERRAGLHMELWHKGDV